MGKKVNFKFTELRLSVHSVERMFERNISENDIEELVHRGEIIETYHDAMPDPCFLVFGMVNKRPLHLVVGLNEKEQRLTVVTLYEPNLSKFEKDYKTRRK
jgi:hypothetical protein